jgi:hypothetical protein
MTRRVRPWVTRGMATMTVAVLLLTGWLLGQRAVPAWRERLITQAIADSGGPAFWWPTSWREEYKRHAHDLAGRIIFLIEVSQGTVAVQEGSTP